MVFIWGNKGYYDFLGYVIFECPSCKTTGIFRVEQVRKKFTADLGAAAVGFAGPGAKKGVKAGTVYTAVAGAKTGFVQKTLIKGSRDTVRKKAANVLINLINNTIAESRTFAFTAEIEV